MTAKPSTEKANELALLREQVVALEVALAKKTKVRTSAVDPVEGSKAVLAAHGDLKTYVALQDGIDHKQGFIPAGGRFSTTQPQGSWMELVDDAPASEGE